MALLERTYTIPLRREWLKSPRYKRAKKAVTAVKDFLEQHMKADKKDIKLGKHLNEQLWQHGIKNPPPRIRINVQKDDQGIVRAELVGKPIIVEKKEEVKTSLAGKLKEKITGQEGEKTKVVKKEIKIGEDKKEEAKPEEKKEEPKPAEDPKEEKPVEKKEEKPAEKKEEKPVEKKEEKPAEKKEEAPAEKKEDPKKEAPKEEKKEVKQEKPAEKEAPKEEKPKQESQ